MSGNSPTYTNVFTGQLVAPALAAYNSIALTGNLQLSWPLETAPNSNLACPLIDINNQSTGAFSLILPPANQVGQGTFLIINNLSAYPQAVYNDTGQVVVASQAAGSVFFYYLQNNQTVGGSWFAFQYGAAVSAPSVAAIAGPGLRPVGSTLGQDIVVQTKNSTYALSNNDQTTLLNWSGGGGSAFTLPPSTTVGANWYVQFRNSGTSVITVGLQSSSDNINGQTAGLALSLNPGDSCILVTDGLGDWYSIGLGPSVATSFNVITVSVAGLSGTLSLSGTQLNQIGYVFTGALSGNLQIVVPATKQEYWVRNISTGGTLTIGTSGQASPPAIATSVAPNASGIFYCDGSNVYLATPQSAISSLPVQISQGGTNATTASAALTNLGGTSIGIAVFTAASNTAAQSAIAASSVADAFVFANVMG
jgi:hypothetical protein